MLLKLPPKLPPRKILIQQVMQIRKGMRKRNRMSRKGSFVRVIVIITTIRAIREMLSNI